MKPNEALGRFELNPGECQALGLETASCDWPIDDATSLVVRAIDRQAQLSDPSRLSDYPAGSTKTHLQNQLSKHDAVLSALIMQVEPYLESSADGAEQFLRDQQ